MNPIEWEALCDGCGKCCLNKIEDEDTGDVVSNTCRLSVIGRSNLSMRQYDIRHQFVPECIVLNPDTIEQNAYWLPKTCAYKLLWDGLPLYDWHP